MSNECPVCHDPLCAASAVGMTDEQRRGVTELVHGLNRFI
jgi:hypothetical protein